jgi:hypothetical protein
MSEVNVSIGQDLIKPIIEAKVQAAITQAVESEKDLVTKFIARSLEVRVDKNGKRNRYEYENKYTMLEYMCYETLKDCAREAIKSWVEDNKSEVRKALTAQLKTTRTTTALAKSIIDGMTNCVKSDWRMSVKVNLETIKDD